jgi:hypothetical protein
LRTISCATSAMTIHDTCVTLIVAAIHDGWMTRPPDG